MSQLGEVFIKVSADTSTFESGMKRAALAATGLSVAIVGLSAKAAGDFEQSIANAAARTENGAARMDDMAAAAKRMGIESAFSAKEAADALGILAQAGLDADQQIAALPATLNIAVAGNLEMAEAAQLSMGALKGFRMEVKDMTKVTDIMTKASISAAQTVQDVGNAMSYVAPVSAGMGVSIEETAAAISVLAENALAGERGGTALRGIMVKMVEASGKLGAGVTTASLRTEGFAASLDKLMAAGLDSSNAVKLFGQRAGPGLLALMGSGTDAIRELTEEMHNAGGTAQSIADKQLDTLNGQMLLLKGSVETLGVEIGARLVPVFRGMAEDMKRQVNELLTNKEAMDSFGETVASATRQIADAMRNLSPVITAAAIGMGLFVDGLKLLKTIAATAVIGVGGLVEAYYEMQYALDGTSENYQKLTGHQERLNKLVVETRGDIHSLGDATASAAELGTKMAEGMEYIANAAEAGADKIKDITSEIGEMGGKIAEVMPPMTAFEAVLNGVETPDELAKLNDKLKKTGENAKKAKHEIIELTEAMKHFPIGDFGTTGPVPTDRPSVDYGKPTETGTGAMVGYEGAGAFAETGRDMARMGEAMKDVVNTSGEMNMAFAAGAGSFAAFPAMFAKMWASTEGFQAIMGEVSDLLGSVFKPIMESVMQDLSKALKPIFKILKAMVPLFKIVITVFNPFILALKAIVVLFDKLKKPFDAIAKAIRKFVNGIRVFLHNLGRTRKSKKWDVDDEGHIRNRATGKRIDGKGGEEREIEEAVVSADTREWRDEQKSLADAASDAGDKVSDFGDAAEDAAEALTNVPVIFQHALRAAQAGNRGFDAAANPQATPDIGAFRGGAGAPIGTVLVDGDVTVVTSDPDSWVEAMQRQRYIKTGSTVADATNIMLETV